MPKPAQIRVRIPSPLFSYTNHRAEVQASGSNVEEITRDLDQQFPGIRFRFLDEQDKIRPHVKIFLNGSQIFDLRTTVCPLDEVAIVQAFSGG